MSEFSGIVSLFLILAAFVTSCNPQQMQGDSKPIAPYFAKN
jgi:predicted small secreted protein